MAKNKRTRALVLMSGGLDSLLAVKVLQDQGVDVVGISFVTPFFGSDRARAAASELGIDLIAHDITEEHLAMVKKPKRGYGKYMNPCIDCHTLMVKTAGGLMEAQGFDLIATGEVLGERPMSQNFRSLMDVGRESGYAEYLLRPLSAKFLPETSLEREGKVDRSRLLAIQGRSRKPQLELVEHYGITSYVQPAGGCLLTDPAYSKRLKDLFTHQPDAGEWEVRLLRLGRQFRLEDGTKVVVGRDEQDNGRIEAAARPEDVLLIAVSIPGPTSMVVGGGSEETIAEAASLSASYGDAKEGQVGMELKHGSDVREISAVPNDRRRWERSRI